ncbi:MAG: hypothetical protein JWQ89_4141 [Devosia sp.]|uniref:hypothetical protein n=1 Tax=Devosia sp. TaxID=1871048 RepID=UPI00260860B3|nr:hypothetical protein [Devosia sp.]MDB5542414.1 hypothetical protein [Devosia sp.]
MAERGLRRWLLAGLLLCAWPAAGHELGDFGRVKPGVLNDEIIPGTDRLMRRLGNQPVSNFNITDQEREMHDRVYRFLIARHARDWAFDYEQVVAVAGLTSRRKGKDDLYYRWLTGERYASSRVRYNTMADDIGADLLTLPSTFAAICAVIEIDRQRAVAAAEIADIEPAMIAEMHERKAENDLHVGRFVAALDYRYASYGYALDHFLVETPHGEAVEVDARLSELAIWVDRAEQQEFCGDWSTGEGGDGAIPGRVLLDAPSEGEYRK